MKAYTHQPASRRKACPFLDIVPLEIREIIYSYVLVVKTECDVKSGEVCVSLAAVHVLAKFTNLLVR